jgi:hypothetical protein
MTKEWGAARLASRAVLRRITPAIEAASACIESNAFSGLAAWKCRDTTGGA